MLYKSKRKKSNEIVERMVRMGMNIYCELQGEISRAEQAVKQEEQRLRDKREFSEEFWLFYKSAAQAYRKALGLLYENNPHLATAHQINSEQIFNLRQRGELFFYVPVPLALYDSNGKPENVVLQPSPKDVREYLDKGYVPVDDGLARKINEELRPGIAV